MNTAIRMARNAVRVKLNITPLNVDIMYYTDDYKKIVFGALGKVFEFTAESTPCRFSKPKWKAQQLWTLVERTEKENI